MVGPVRRGYARVVLLTFVLLVSHPGLAQKFFPDDPLQNELPPLDTPFSNPRALSALLDFFTGAFTSPGERQPANGVITAQGVNTMGEVMEGAWYVARQSRKRMTPEELRRGIGDAQPPEVQQPWRVLTVKGQGFRTGILIKDGKNREYLLRFDPIDYPELTTGASIIASKFLYALGYWTPENYIVYFQRNQLRAATEGADVDSRGQIRTLLEEDIDRFLENVPRDKARGYRALATRVPDGVPLGPFKFEGRRSDDPNDLFIHEHRRELRGLFVFSAWLNNITPEPTSTLDMLVTDEIGGKPVRYIRHYYVDFGASLGSGVDRVKQIEQGNEPIFSANDLKSNALSAGITAPEWMKADFPNLPAVGRFECRTFDPEQWSPRYLTAPLANRLPDDDFWATRALMTLTDDDIRTVVATAEYTDPAARTWISDCLIERRNRIGRAYFKKVLPLDGFRAEGGRLLFDDLAVRYGFVAPRRFQIQWARFDNQHNQAFALPGVTGDAIPQVFLNAKSGEYVRAEITPENAVAGGAAGNLGVNVYLRREASGIGIVGVERTWPGKVVVEPRSPNAADTKDRYSRLSDPQRQLFESYAKAYSERTQIHVNAEEAWSILSVSEQTTFDAVTDAMEKTALSDRANKSLGDALSLCVRVDRIAGQYGGQGGDQQYRIYCDLRPDARDVVEKSTQFRRDKDNTVYHVGYPLNYRQTGRAPTMQISMSTDASRADIDVDYRDSGLPRSMWNGHNTSANSDIRAGDNHTRHIKRWPGMSAWWVGLFNNFEVAGAPLTGLLSQPPRVEYLNLPPDRPSGANPENIEDAAQEFLTDWLQRKNQKQAMEFVSNQALRCMGEADATPIVVSSVEQARSALGDVMHDVSDRLGPIKNLAEAIQGVEPWRPELGATLKNHPFRPAFSVFHLPEQTARTYLCNQHPALERAANEAAARTEQDSYEGSLFQFRFGRDQGGVLGLLWAREANHWKIVAYTVIRQ